MDYYYYYIITNNLVSSVEWRKSVQKFTDTDRLSNVSSMQYVQAGRSISRAHLLKRVYTICERR